MRILHVSDFHFRQPWFEWLGNQAGNFDVYCLTGDLLDLFAGHKVSLRRQTRWVRDWLQQFPGKLCVCTGNHDWWPADERVVDNDTEGGWLKKAARPGLILDGGAEIIGGYRFLCQPWALAPKIDPSMRSVVLVHAPPYGTIVSTDQIDGEVGDPDVARDIRVLLPGSLVLSGHVHLPKNWYVRFGQVWCFNPGVDLDAAEPNRIVIDTDRREATLSGWGKQLGPIQL